ncbi:uncharacterized protein [Oscarella lobularis]|uniref:uncharacterized protein isoform X2 n=1 Tax=Oscarella lobularis TaxID=121494 RepID=UPI003313199C
MRQSGLWRRYVAEAKSKVASRLLLLLVDRRRAMVLRIVGFECFGGYEPNPSESKWDKVVIEISVGVRYLKIGASRPLLSHFEFQIGSSLNIASGSQRYRLNMTPLTALVFSLMFNAGSAYYLGDPGVFDQLINKYGSNMGTMNGSGLSIYMIGDELVGKVTPPSAFRVLDFLKLMLPSVATTLGIDETNSDNPFNFPVDNFTLNMVDNFWCMGTQELPSMPLVSQFMTLSDVTVLVCLELDPEANSLADRIQVSSFAIAGVWQMGSISLEFKFSRVGPTYYFSGAPTTGLPVGTFIEYLGAKLLPDEFATPLKNSGLDRFSIEKARFIGVYDSDGFAIGLSGNPTIQGWGSFRCHLIFTRYVRREYQEGGVAVTIAINFPDFSLANLVQKLSGYDISDVPLLGTLRVPETGVVISTRDLIPNMLPEVLDGILAQAMPIYKGLTFATALPIIPNQAAVVFVVHIGSGGLMFTMTDPGGALTLGNILSAVIPNFSLDELSLPPGISDIVQSLLNIQLHGFSISTKPKCIAVELRLNQAFEVVPGIARIINPSLFINVTFAKPRKTVTKADGDWEFGSSQFPITIEPAPPPPRLPGQNNQLVKAKGFLLTGEGDEISVQSIISKFDADFLPEELQSVLQAASMLDFAIENPTFRIPIGTGAKGFQCQFSGTPRINGWSGVTLNAVVSKTTGKAALAVGFEFVNMGIADLVQKLTDVNVKALTLLDRSLKVAVMISSRSLEDVVLQGEALSQIPLRRGLSIVAVFTFPTDCLGESFCEFAKGALGSGASLQIAATITSLRQFSFSVGVNNIKLGEGIILSEAALEFAIGMETYVGIRATLTLSNPPLSFTGWVRAGIQGLELGMTMSGIWKRPFGIDFLAFGKGIISITLKPGVPLPGIELGGEVRVGKLDSGREIIAKVYLGIDPTMPRRNYFYGSINRLTIGSVLEAFDIQLSLPKCLADSGLPYGLKVSFSLDSRELVPSGIVIPQGFILNGTIDILGWRLKAYINIGLPRGIKIDIRMDPLTIGGGILKLYKSTTETTVGPLLVADVTASPPNVNVTAAGYVSLFFGMIEAEIFLQITNTHFLFYVRRRFFIFEALLKVYASYGSLQDASFQVYGLLSTAWLEELERSVCAKIDAAAKVATDKIDAAKRKVDGAHAKFDAVVADLRRKRNNVNNLCHLRTCHSICMGCPSWNSCCTRWWGSCIGCPSWNYCCWRAPNIICEVANLGCKALRGIAYAALWLAEKIVDSSRWTLELAKGVLDAVKWTVRIAAEAAKFIVRLGLGGIISIKKIEFDVKIGIAKSGYFSGSIVVSFLRRAEITMGFYLRLPSVQSMASDLADAIFPGITGRRKRDVEDQLRQNMPDYSRRHYLPDMYVYKPGSAAEYRPRREYPIPEEVYEKTEFVVRKRSLTDELQAEKAHIDTDLVDMRNRVKQFVRPSSVAAAAPPAPNATKTRLLPLTQLKQSLNTSAEKCSHFGNIKQFILEIPLAMEAVYGEWKNTVGNYTNELGVLTEGYTNVSMQEAEATAKAAQAQQDFSNLVAAERNQSDLIEEARNLTNITSTPSFLTAADSVTFRNNMTEETINKQLVAEIGNGYSEWNRTLKDEVVSENVRTVKAIVQAYGNDVMAETNLTLTQYINEVFKALKAPYETISSGDTHFDSAVNLLESLAAIKRNLDTLITETVFKAKEISDTLLAELKEIAQIKIFCSAS